jgi:hypothetical protein
MSTPSQDYRRFFSEDVQQVEMPNQLNSRGQQSNLEHISPDESYNMGFKPASAKTQGTESF